MARGRTSSRESKPTVVREAASGAKRPAQLCRERGLDEGVLLRWRREDEARGEAAFTPREATGTEALGRKIAEPGRFRGQLALENAALRKGLSALPPRSATR
ncbi:MAG TPA: transposase [Thermomicrobiales bacterium]|nr:transposase [Thermomicrobiales bacterium]